MPMSEDLLLAQNDVIKQKWIFSIITKISGHCHWPKKSTMFILRELSKIRILNQKALTETFDQNWNPVSRKCPMQMGAKTTPEDIFDIAENKWNVNINDFNPGGRLYGIYVKMDEPLPSHIQHRFSPQQIPLMARDRLHQDIISIRAQWSKGVMTQLAIQNGQPQVTTRNTIPPWLHEVELQNKMQYQRSQQLSFEDIEDRCDKLQLQTKDFLRKGRLESFPTEGSKIMTSSILRNLNFPEVMNKKDCAFLLRHIHQFIRENLQQIVKKRQEEKYTTPPSTPTKYYYPMAPQKPAEMKHQTSFQRNLSHQFDQTSKRGRQFQRPRTGSPPLTRAASRRRSQSRTTRATSEGTQSTSSEITSESILTIDHQPTETWNKAEKIIKLGMENQQTFTFPEAPIFQQPTAIPNPFQWNGDKSTAPRWTKQPLSADTLNHMKYNQIPAHHKPRLVRSMCHRQIPLDGVNRILDVFIDHYRGDHNDLRDFGIAISTTSKERGNDSTQTENTHMKIPFMDYLHVKTILQEAEKAMLPPAFEDDEKEESSLFSQISKSTYFNYRVEISVLRSTHGSERILHIIQENDKDQIFNAFTIPWRFTSILLVKFDSARQEIAYMQNELYITSKGHIQAPRMDRMDRSEIVEAEEATTHFQR
jgi:hypothetical protein